MTFLLLHAGVLQEPLLYLSLYLKQHRSTYYELLNQVRLTGDWESWLGFFLEGVRVTAESAVDTSRRMLELFATDRGTIEERGRRAGSGLRIHEALKERPVITIGAAAERTGLSFAGASSAMQLLIELGIAREVTGKRRNRVYVYDRYGRC